LQESFRELSVLMRRLRLSVFAGLLWLIHPWAVEAQGGPPYFTNDPATPGPLRWEINFGYIPQLSRVQSRTSMPDVDLNFGLGQRIQLTCEFSWVRLNIDPATPQYGLSQDELGVKWRFYDNDRQGLAISVFPQVAVNNPARASVEPGEGASLTLPVQITKRLGPVSVDGEFGYTLVHGGPNGWLVGVVAGHEKTIGHKHPKLLEFDVEFYASGDVDGQLSQETIGGGVRYKLHPPVIVLAMAGRGLHHTLEGQPSFVAYVGLQFLLPPRPFEKGD
jgi:hypothetical protein